jgi:hypothetical protein
MKYLLNKYKMYVKNGFTDAFCKMLFLITVGRYTGTELDFSLQEIN